MTNMDVYDVIQVLTDAGSNYDVYVVVNGEKYDIDCIHIDNGFVEISVIKGGNTNGSV